MPFSSLFSPASDANSGLFRMRKVSPSPSPSPSAHRADRRRPARQVRASASARERGRQRALAERAGQLLADARGGRQAGAAAWLWSSEDERALDARTGGVLHGRAFLPLDSPAAKSEGFFPAPNGGGRSSSSIPASDGRMQRHRAPGCRRRSPRRRHRPDLQKPSHANTKASCARTPPPAAAAARRRSSIPGPARARLLLWPSAPPPTVSPAHRSGVTGKAARWRPGTRRPARLGG
ncbi:serine/arginine repetitive matrix protein 2 [Triticum aestivum]|uniref:serine/arginine repetitive matrix protein 2 n=1 Tax=Triticum aestivum TaxID=4565 RepID=UPI001D013F97|nr:serine/arginine repetitive matrix protein 2-like [Triticum aestivum]